MAHSLKTALCLIMVASLALSAKAKGTMDPREVLVDNYDDGSEMAQRIIGEFLG